MIVRDKARSVGAGGTAETAAGAGPRGAVAELPRPKRRPLRPRERPAGAAAAEPPEAAAPAAAPGAACADLFRELRFGYRPIWDSARNAIAAYLCVAEVPISDVAAVHGEAELALSDDIAEMARLDAALQQRVLSDLGVLTAAKRRLMITLPVHFDSLGQAAWRRKYLADLAQLEADGRRLVMVEIVGVPPGVLQSRLLDLIAPFRALCRGIILRLSADMKEFVQIRGCGAAALACDLTGRPDGEKALDQQMNRFVRLAERASLPSYLHGAQTISLVMAALGAGFHYIDGSALAKLVDHPQHAVEFRLRDLYDGTTLPAA
jgi:hypothetical protein